MQLFLAANKAPDTMENRESILDTILEEEDMEEVDDVEMLDAEDGELVDGMNSHAQHAEGGANEVKSQPLNRNRRRRKNKKKNKKSKGNSGSSVTDINRYVLDVCRRLKEKKSYLVYTAVGCLGVSALGELVKEVEAIQACGGQKTADGNRLRTGGGILWNILKARDPNAYKEIMQKGKEFEKQFRANPSIRQAGGKDQENPSVSAAAVAKQTPDSNSDSLQQISPVQGQPKVLNSEEKRISLEGRMRMPVSYDDIVDEPEPTVDHLARG